MRFGLDDPEAWLDAQDQRKLALWQGYFEVEPPGSEWERHAQQMAKLDAMLGVLINTNIKSDTAPYKPGSVRDFLPDGWQDIAETTQPLESQMQAAKGIANPTAKVIYGDDNQ